MPPKVPPQESAFLSGAYQGCLRETHPDRPFHKRCVLTPTCPRKSIDANGRNLWIVVGWAGCRCDGVFTGDIGYDNVHPALIAFLNVCKIPVLPASLSGFGLRNRRGRLFHFNDALRRVQGRTLMDNDVKMRVINILDGVFGRGWQVLIVTLIAGSLIVGGSTGG